LKVAEELSGLSEDLASASASSFWPRAPGVGDSRGRLPAGWAGRHDDARAKRRSEIGEVRHRVTNRAVRRLGKLARAIAMRAAEPGLAGADLVDERQVETVAR